MDTKLMVDVVTGVMEEYGIMCSMNERNTQRFCEKLEAAFKAASAGGRCDCNPSERVKCDGGKSIADEVAGDAIYQAKDPVAPYWEDVSKEIYEKAAAQFYDTRIVYTCPPAPKASAPDAPAGDLPPLPAPDYVQCRMGADDVNYFAEETMRAYVLADRAAAAPAGHAEPVACEQDIMVEIYDYGNIRDGINSAEEPKRTEQRNAMHAQAQKIRGMLRGIAAPVAAEPAPQVIYREPTLEERHLDGVAKLMASADKHGGDHE